ncbi:hypothetical protein ACHQM5_011968 [Ranunculus cassubicifolius]
MKTLLNSPSHFPISSQTSLKPFNFSSSKSPPLFIVKCNSEDNNNNGGLKSALSGMVDKRVEELLNKEENKGLFDGLEKASLRVERAKLELAEIKRQELEAAELRKYVDVLESRKSEIAECQKEMSEARALVEEAERSLSMNQNISSSSDEDKEIMKEIERFESVKAASISALIGTLAGLPISISQVSTPEQLILPVAITFISCALFGVTFRYTMRRDLDDIHLKSGVVAAFAIAQGLGAVGAGPPLELTLESFMSHAVNGAVYVSENLLIYFFAAIALDFCFKMQLLSPFPFKTSSSSER